MTRAASLAVAVAALVIAVPAFAAPEFSVATFTGPGAVNIRNQLVRAVCDQLACAPTAKKGKKAPPTLNGRVIKSKKATTLELWLVQAGKTKWRKPFAVNKAMKLDDDVVDSAAKLVLSTMDVQPAKQPEPPPAPPPQPEPERKLSDPATDWSSPSQPAATTTTTETPAETKPETPSSSDGYKPPTVAASVNLDLLYRAFTFSGLTTNNASEYKGFPIAAPHLHLDAYPLVPFVDGMLAGLGLEADFSFTLGLKAIAGSGASKIEYPSQLLRFNGGLKFRIPLTSSGIAVVPAVGVAYTSFSISKNDQGNKLEGLPQVAYTSLKVGVGAEAPLLDNKLLLFLNVSFLPTFAAGEIISPTYFPEGKLWGLMGHLGASYQIIGGLEARLVFQFERYDLSFTFKDGDKYNAAGAADLMIGGTLGVGYRF